MHDNSSAVSGKRPHIELRFQHNRDNGTTSYRVTDHRNGSTFSRVMPTKAFVALLQDIAAHCRVAQVLP